MNPSIHLEPSATIKINSIALEKQKSGQRIFNLSVGEPMVDTPELVKQSAIDAMQKNYTHYPPVAGIPELRETACAWMNDDFGADYSVSETLVSVGGKMGLYMLLQAYVSIGDEVIIPAPYWVSYPSMVKIFGGIPKIIETKEDEEWKIQPDVLEALITPHTKFIMLNNASNPTGVLYSRAELHAILSIAKKHNVMVISDEVYSGLVYDGGEYVSCATFPEFKDSVVIIQSCSKSFAMTGWRVGFLFAPQDMIQVLASLTGQTTSGVSTIAQYAGHTAIQHRKEIVSDICTVMQTRRDVFIDTFNSAFACNVKKPASALYSFIPMSAFGTDETDSLAFCERVIDTIGVALVPGVAFGKDGYVRSAFGIEEQELRESVDVLRGFFK
jgi:aspartate/methionine/tyrosine aminotransferase